MKTLITLLSILVLAAWDTATAQPQPGYWVVETNVKTKDYSIVRFYTAAHVQMHQERLDGVCLDITRRRIRRQLDAALAQAARNWVVVQGPPRYRHLAARPSGVR